MFLSMNLETLKEKSLTIGVPGRHTVVRGEAVFAVSARHKRLTWTLYLYIYIYIYVFIVV